MHDNTLIPAELWHYNVTVNIDKSEMLFDF